MKVAGFNFNKISIEKMNNISNDMKLNTNIDISTIREAKTDLFKTKEEIIVVDFTFSLNYDPDIAKIELKGSIILALEPRIAKDILKQWKQKEMPPQFRIDLFNIILRKSTLKCLQLEEELNLPLHIRLPSFKMEEEKK